MSLKTPNPRKGIKTVGNLGIAPGEVHGRLKTPNPRKGIKTVWQKVSRLEWGPGLKTPNPRKGITKPAEAAARAAFAAFAAFALNAHLA